jgi:outer membrane protein OmpA-like peptidoglycan-associated protein
MGELAVRDKSGSAGLSEAFAAMMDRIDGSEHPATQDIPVEELSRLLGLHALSIEGTEPVGTPEPSIDDLRQASTFDEPHGRRIWPAILAVPLAIVVGTIVWWPGNNPETTSPRTPVAPTTIVTASPTTTTEPADEPEPAGRVDTDADLPAAVVAAISELGLQGVTVTVIEGRALVEGVVDPATLGDGYFARIDTIRASALSAGAVEAEVRLDLRGNAATLRGALAALSPITFESGSSVVGEEHEATLDVAAEAITRHPGLPVIVAGTTDPTGSSESNEALARARARAVAEALYARGVAPGRLQLVSYGELFAAEPDLDPALARRVVLEVGA